MKKKYIMRALCPLLMSCLLLAGCGNHPDEKQNPGTTAEHAATAESTAENTKTAASEESAEQTEPNEIVINGKTYPLDIQELTVSNVADLDQLRYATGLTSLTLLVNTDQAAVSWDWMEALSTVESLMIRVSGSKETDIDLRKLNGCKSLGILSVQSSSRITSLTIPSVSSLLRCEVALEAGADVLDASGCTGLTMLSLDGIAPDTLKIGDGLEQVICSCTAFDLTLLKKFPNVSRLSLYGTGWDLSQLEETGVSKLTVQGGTADELKQLAGNAKLTALQVTDDTVTDISVAEELPALESLIIGVDPNQENWNQLSEAAGQPVQISEETLYLIETSVPLEQLKSFMERGIQVYMVSDLNRR